MKPQLTPVLWEDHCGNPHASRGGLSPCTLQYEPDSKPGGYLPDDLVERRGLDRVTLVRGVVL